MLERLGIEPVVGSIPGQTHTGMYRKAINWCFSPFLFKSNEKMSLDRIKKYFLKRISIIISTFFVHYNEIILILFQFCLHPKLWYNPTFPPHSAFVHLQMFIANINWKLVVCMNSLYLHADASFAHGMGFGEFPNSKYEVKKTTLNVMFSIKET